jgi:hypothetical protein
MKINRHILSIPPHISTAWNNIRSLHVTHENAQTFLVITLLNQSVISIPNLSATTIEEIFQMHTKFLEQGSSQQEVAKEPSKTLPPFAFGGEASLTFGLPLKMGEGDVLNSFGGFLQHSQEQANSPPLPQEMLKKVAAISKAMGLDKHIENMPKAEPHCNCPHCQVARALHEEPPRSPLPEKQSIDEPVEDAELKFREWDIQEIESQLYEVSNPFDAVERYQVFLGNPLGCTCGHKNCAHIKAVLNS